MTYHSLDAESKSLCASDEEIYKLIYYYFFGEYFWIVEEQRKQI